MATMLARALAEGLRRLMLVGAVAGACVASGCALGPPSARDREAVLARILPSSVQVVVEQREGRRVRSGSGVAVAERRDGAEPRCIVVTSGHLFTGLLGRSDAYVLFGRASGEGSKVAASVVLHRDTADTDLAVLATAIPGCVPARPAVRPSLGEPVWVVAFPWGGEMTLAAGIVSQVRREGDASASPARFMIDALVGYGASGGGVYQADTGRLLGIVEGYGTARVAAQGGTSGWYIDVPMPGRTFVMSLGDIRRHLARAGRDDLLRPPD